MEHAFKVKDLQYNYRTSEDVIRGVSFDVHSEEVFGLLGPSGAGKTTMKILIKLLEGYRAKLLISKGFKINRQKSFMKRSASGLRCGAFYQDDRA